MFIHFTGREARKLARRPAREARGVTNIYYFRSLSYSGNMVFPHSEIQIKGVIGAAMQRCSL